MRKPRKFPMNGPTMAMQAKYWNGEIPAKEFLKHCADKLKGK